MLKNMAFHDIIHKVPKIGVSYNGGGSKMRKLFLFWVLWAACWVLIIELMIGFNLTPYQPLGGLVVGAIIDIFAAVIFVHHRVLMYVGVIIFSLVLIFSFSFVILVCYLLSMALLVVTYYALK